MLRPCAGKAPQGKFIDKRTTWNKVLKSKRTKLSESSILSPNFGIQL